MSSRGVVYVLTHSVSIAFARCLDASLRALRTVYSGEVTILRDEALGLDAQTAAPEFKARDLKTRLFELTPYEQTLYLDVDVLPLRRFDMLWDLQEDFAARAYAPPPGWLAKDRNDTLKVPHFSSGVMYFRKNVAMQELFKKWHAHWLEFKEYDQWALQHAVAEHDGKFSAMALAPEWHLLYTEAQNSAEAMKQNAIFWHSNRDWFDMANAASVLERKAT